MTANFKIYRPKSSLGEVYAPTDDSPIQIKEDFFEQAKEALLKISNQLGAIYLNARTERSQIDPTIGNHSENVL